MAEETSGRTLALDEYDPWGKLWTDWPDPQPYLREARQQAGHDAQEAEAAPPRGTSRRDQTLADLAVYEEARRLFLELIGNGRSDLEERLANVCGNEALVHWYLGDTPGLLALDDQAIGIYERLVRQNGRSGPALELAIIYANKAFAMRSLRDYRAALALYDQTIAIRERLVHQEGRSELISGLAGVYLHKARTLSGAGDQRRGGVDRPNHRHLRAACQPGGPRRIHRRPGQRLLEQGACSTVRRKPAARRRCAIGPLPSTGGLSSRTAGGFGPSTSPAPTSPRRCC